MSRGNHVVATSQLVATCRYLSQLPILGSLTLDGMEGRICCSTGGSPSPLFTLLFPPSSLIAGKFSVSPSDVVSPDESVLQPRQSKEARGWMIPKSSCADNCLRRAANKKHAGRIRPQPRSTSRPILLIHSTYQVNSILDQPHPLKLTQF